MSLRRSLGELLPSPGMELTRALALLYCSRCCSGLMLSKFINKRPKLKFKSREVKDRGTISIYQKIFQLLGCFFFCSFSPADRQKWLLCPLKICQYFNIHSDLQASLPLQQQKQPRQRRSPSPEKQKKGDRA